MLLLGLTLLSISVTSYSDFQEIDIDISISLTRYQLVYFLSATDKRVIRNRVICVNKGFFNYSNAQLNYMIIKSY